MQTFVRPLLDYADMICDKPCNESFKGKHEAVKYNPCLAITSAIRGTSRGRHLEIGCSGVYL